MIRQLHTMLARHCYCGVARSSQPWRAFSAMGKDEPVTVVLEQRQRHTEDIDTTRRRLQYQMRKRGILETDLLLSTFASQHLRSLEREELADLDALLVNIDWDIFYWATGKTQPPQAVQDMAVFQKLKEHAAKRGNTIVRMPDLDQTK